MREEIQKLLIILLQDNLDINILTDSFIAALCVYMQQENTDDKKDFSCEISDSKQEFKVHLWKDEQNQLQMQISANSTDET
ncbi:MAG: hypothetical protein K2M78_08180 [Lachnospiraceae bacterium]|nr:hypothetical protein [Lachnospiraceae bacterium]